MIDRGLAPHERLVERFVSAVDAFVGDARAEELPKYVQNLQWVETDMLLVDPTAVALPSWLPD